ncbi:MAG: AAA family ATPase [Rhizomicrobium sp.]
MHLWLKNLKNVTIDFDQNHWVTVLIGWNGTGKSNVLEALAIIFRDLMDDKKKSPPFAYRLSYKIGVGSAERSVWLNADPDRTDEPLVIHTSTPGTVELDTRESQGRRITLAEFRRPTNNLLPKYIFSYYSGESHRMFDVFRPYLETYDNQLRNGRDPGMKRLFFALPVHSQFVLLAFLIQQNDTVRAFLNDHFGIDPDEGVESVLFVIKKPPWKSRAPDGDERFWNARGVVKDFLARLYDISLAPFRLHRTVAKTIWAKGRSEFLYLYVKDMQALRKLVGSDAPSSFFRDLESTYVSELIDEVLIRVRLRNGEAVTFRELSEGEQQLLTVLGLLRFTASEESLFLLDEPDTHLNPRWCVDYLDYLHRFVGFDRDAEATSHIVLTTHNPLAIAELKKEQVQILRMRETGTGRCINAVHPELDPRGQGYGAIVTSDMFGIASSLDKSTQELLEEQRLLAGRESLTANEQRRLDDLNAQLERLGFRFFLPDDEYSRFLRLRHDRLRKLFD